ncbi:MAG TPA: serine hydrolase [Polyangiaceae bacterium]
MSDSHISWNGCRMGALGLPLLLALTTAACSSSDAEGERAGDPLAIGQQAPWPTREWTVVTPQEMDMDPAQLENARAYAMRPAQNTQGVVVVRGGAIVAEWYADGYDASSFANSWSMAKSFTSASLGIAIEEGLVGGIDDTLEEYYPEWANTEKGRIPLHSLLQMQSGLDFIEDYADITNSDVIAIGGTDDTLKYVLDKVNVKVPYDTQWYYSGGDTLLLSGIIERKTGKSTTDYAAKKIFEPIGMNPVEWWVDGKDQTIAFCCMDAPIRQFAKFGLLFLRGGEWDGKRVVPKAWVKESTTTRAQHYDGYAYQWWLAQGDSKLPKDLYWASGKDGQAIYVIPSLDLVVAKNTIYRKAPGPAIADTGYINKMTPGGLTQYGTLAAQLWEDGPFLSAIIRSIAGTSQEEIPATPPPGSSPNDPALCREKSKTTFAGYCEEMHGCVCKDCAPELLDCHNNDQCKAILQCALEVECRGIACAAPCAQVIEESGGVQGAGVALALHVSECSTNCPTSCP